MDQEPQPKALVEQAAKAWAADQNAEAASLVQRLAISLGIDSQYGYLCLFEAIKTWSKVESLCYESREYKMRLDPIQTEH